MQSSARFLSNSAPHPDIPALRDRPSRLFVEVTTRCNLHCSMCVKHSEGSGIAEGDMTEATFEAVAPALPSLEALILSGIGEPLLNPRLEEFIRRAKASMPGGSWVGFQSNGLLLDELRALSLAEAGLDRICLSVDAVSASTFCAVRQGGDWSHIQRAFAALNTARSRAARPDLQIGIEFVVRRDNLRELPDALRWAASAGASFAIVTHLIPYAPDMTAIAAYDSNTDEAGRLFERWRRKAAGEGLDIARFYDVRWKYRKTPQEQRLVTLVEGMTAEARSRGLFFHFRNLLERNEAFLEELNRVFLSAQSVAEETGLKLSLPAVAPSAAKRCEFIEKGSCFVSWDGAVHPCHFLWHHYQCYVSGWRKYVNRKVFGNVTGQGLLDIWNGLEYRSFRETVVSYDFPCCSNCNLAPCDYIDSIEFQQDCYTNTIPCCDCQWCMGLFQCLQ